MESDRVVKGVPTVRVTGACQGVEEVAGLQGKWYSDRGYGRLLVGSDRVTGVLTG